jgi:pimeloyl-ACP methyl ester carboxylesterase
MMPYATVAGERLFYALVEGDATRKKNLILVHGAGGDHTHWPAELRRMPRVNVYALDLAGHGRSEGKGRTSVDDYADSVHLFAQALSLETASVVGHSMGSAIAQTLALRRPPWLERVVLVGTGARLRVHPLILEGLQPSLTSDPATTSPASNFKTAIDTICRWAYGPHTSQQVLRRGHHQLLSVDPQVIYGDYIACNNFDVMERVKYITLPTLIIVGSADQMTPPKYGQYLHAQIPNAKLVEIKDGGHMMAVEKPVEVTQAVAHFLEILKADF